MSAAPTPTPTPAIERTTTQTTSALSRVAVKVSAIELTTTQTTSALSRVAVKVSSHKPRKATCEYAEPYVESLPDLQHLPQRSNARSDLQGRGSREARASNGTIVVLRL